MLGQPEMRTLVLVISRTMPTMAAMVGHKKLRREHQPNQITCQTTS